MERLAASILVPALAAVVAADLLQWPAVTGLVSRILVATTAGLLLARTAQHLLQALPHARLPRLHIALHLAPLSWLLLDTLPSQPFPAPAHVLLMVLFFLTGTATWKLAHRIFGRRIYRLFQLGNLQMTFYFPAACLLDAMNWLPGSLDGLTRVYFLIHFLLAARIVPLLTADLRRLAKSASAQASS